MSSRREFLRRGMAGAVALSVPNASRLDGTRPEARPGDAPDDAPPSFLDVRRAPDAVIVETAAGTQALRSVSATRWEGSQLSVTLAEVHGAVRVRLEASSIAVRRLRLRWRGNLDGVRRLLGDAWERGYGDLEWRGFVPDRVMPWYFAAWDGSRADAYGVRTGANAFCFWQADPHGISLVADVRSGGTGVQLGARVLDVCDVTCRGGQEGESAFAALRAFCRELCASPRLPRQPVYGSNDWYWAYGRNSAASALDDAHRIVELSPPGENRPFSVIDDGWQPERGSDKQGVGTWDRGNEKFPDLPGLPAQVRAAGARPGIWIRPLLAPVGVPDRWRLPRLRTVLDPTVAEVRGKVAEDVARLRQWGFELVKHDYSTYDLLGRWGPKLGASLTDDGWTFAEGPMHTTAEVIGQLYRTIREAAGDAIVIGCNTVNHLAAGVFEMCRIGDDTSGQEWARTRRMGVNTLAFRAAQQGAFYAADPDCVGVTKAIPWTENRQWLDLVARSGTTLFVSLAADAVGPEQRRDLQAALALAARPQPTGEPLDWQHTIWPERWRLMDEERRYDWIGEDGVVTI